MANALVFGGGGGKGAYEIGIWEALYTLGVDRVFSCVIGTSVGSLNAALFGQHSLQRAQRVWSTISNELILETNFMQGDALASQRGLEGLLRRNLLETPSDISIYVCCSRIDQGAESGNLFAGSDGTVSLFGVNSEESYSPEYIRLNDHPLEKQIRYLLASSALPVAYDKVDIEGISYRDGGMVPGHNLPYRKAVELGYQKILAVSLENGVCHKMSVHDSGVFIIYPSESLGDLADGTLDFDSRRAKWRMELGYHDGLRLGNEIVEFLDLNASILGELPTWVKARLRRMI